MDWLNIFKSKKDYPQFWMNYLQEFKSKKSDVFVAFDCETTGLDPKQDKILSIGAVKFTGERIFINESKEWFVKQSFNVDESVKIHGILPANSSRASLSEDEAVKAFLKFIGNATLIGHHVNFDISMVNQALKRLGAGKLKNKQKDTNRLYKDKGHFANEQNFSLDDLCEKYKIKASNRHTALGDAYITAQAFQRLINQ